MEQTQVGEQRPATVEETPKRRQRIDLDALLWRFPLNVHLVMTGYLFFWLLPYRVVGWRIEYDPFSNGSDSTGFVDYAIKMAFVCWIIAVFECQFRGLRKYYGRLERAWLAFLPILLIVMAYLSCDIHLSPSV